VSGSLLECVAKCALRIVYTRMLSQLKGLRAGDSQGCISSYLGASVTQAKARKDEAVWMSRGAPGIPNRKCLPPCKQKHLRMRNTAHPLASRCE